MVHKTLAILFIIAVFTTAAWTADTVHDVGNPKPDDDILDTSGSKGEQSASTTTITNATDDIFIGSSTGGKVTLGKISAGVGDVVINGTSDGTNAFDGNAEDFSLTATSITAGDEIVLENDGANPSITDLTLTGGLSAGGALTVTNVDMSLTGGKMSVVGKATFTDAVVDVLGGASAAAKSTYAGGLDVIGTTYSDGGDVDIGNDSVWGVAGNPDQAADVEIAGTVTMTANDENLTITGGSTATLGGFKWGLAPGGISASLLTIDEASTLTITNTDTAVVFRDEITGSSQMLSIRGGSAVTFAGEVQFTDVGINSPLHVSSGAMNYLNAGSLTIGDGKTAVATDVKSVADLTITVEGVTTVHDQAELTIAGTTDKYNGGIVVNKGGALIGDTTADAAFFAGDAGVTLQDGGRLETVTSGNTLTIAGKGGVNVVNDGKTAAEIGSSASISHIVIENGLHVAGNVDMASGAPGSSLTVGSYTQVSGIAHQVSHGQFTVEGKAEITGENSVFGLLATGVANDTTTFAGGLTLADGAVLETLGATNSFTLGDAKTLTLAGGTINASSGNDFTIIGGSKLNVTTAGSAIHGGSAVFVASDLALVVDDATFSDDISLIMTGTAAAFADIHIVQGELATEVVTTQTAKDLIIEDGASLYNSANATTFTAIGANSVFNAKAGSRLGADEDFAFLGFSNATLNGIMLMDQNAAGVSSIASDAATTTVGNDAVFAFTPEAAAAIAADLEGGTAYVAVRNTGAGTLTVTEEVKQQNSALGFFTFDYDDTAKALYLTAASRIVSGAGDAADRELFYTNAHDSRAPFGSGREIDWSLATASYDAIFTDDISSNSTWLELAPDTPPLGGQLTLDLLQDMALKPNAGSIYTEGVGKSIFRNGDVSEMLHAGFGELGGITSAIGVRSVRLRGELRGQGYSQARQGRDGYRYNYGNPTLLMPADYTARVWAGYLGRWESSDTRNGVSGYDYGSNGVVTGLDFLAGQNLALGAAFAYSRGKYEDAAATANDSKTNNYALEGYLTYSADNGFFGSLYGGFMRQDNEIRASYRTTAKTADYNTNIWNIGGALGLDIQPVDGLFLTPSIGLHYLSGRADAHSSTWTGVGGQFGGGNVAEASRKALLLPVELAARYNVQFSDKVRLTLEGNVGYSYNLLNSSGAADMTLANIIYNDAQTPAVIAGYDRDPGRHTINAGAGFRFTLGRVDIGAKYDYYAQSNANAHRVTGSLGVNF